MAFNYPPADTETDAAPPLPPDEDTAEAGQSAKDCVMQHDDGNTQKKEEEKEDKYELYIIVEEAVSGKKLDGIEVLYKKKNTSYPFTYVSKDGGMVKRELGDHEEEYEIEVHLNETQNKYEYLKMSEVLKTRPLDGTPHKISLETLLLEITKVDDHFVPTRTDDSENLEIGYNINKLPDKNIRLKISSEQHHPKIIFEHVLTNAEKANGQYIFKWNGESNCNDGELKGKKLINPLFSPFKIILECTDNNLQSNEVETKVLYHSIKLKKGSYIEDPDSPPARISPVPAKGHADWTKHMKWVQHRLNELGYFAGPVDGTENPQTKRAIKRYTYEMINHPESDDASNKKFCDSLFGFGPDLKVNLFEKDSVIEDKGAKSKIFIQHNYFYHTDGAGGTTNWNSADGHYDKENNHGMAKGGKLDRFEIPVEASITLISKKDASGNPDLTKGVESPEALGDAEIKWSIIDPDEDTSLVPSKTSVAPSQAKTFLTDVITRVKAKYNGRDNCPEECGGVKRTDDYFVPMISQIPVRKVASNDHVFSKIYRADPASRKFGKTGVLFKGSNIAGDNYQINAEISFENCANKNSLITDHSATRNIDVLSAKTGEMTVWRLHRVASVIDWCDQPLPPVDWSEIIPAFEVAFNQLDISSLTQKKIGDLVTSKAKADKYFNLAASEWIPLHDHVNRDNRIAAIKSRMEINNDSMFPLPLIKGDILEKKIKETDDQFQKRIKHWLDLAGTWDNLLQRLTLGNITEGSLGDWLSVLNNETQRPGVLILRALPYKGYDLTKKTGLLRRTVIVEEKKYRREGSLCSGVGGGLVFICESYRKKLKDGFLTAHEIAHLYYLSHPFQFAVEHDSTDENCTMWYLHTEAGKAPPNRKNLPLDNKTIYETKFCGRCLLKLRGWKVRDPGITVLPPASAIVPIQTPCNPVMRFVEYKIQEGSFGAIVAGKEDFYDLKEDSKDPANPAIPLGPMQFLHVHELRWESTDGNLKSLAKIKTREKVVYDKPTQGPPFCEAADADQDFVQDGKDADTGKCFDDHSVMCPSLICGRPRVAGKITAVQRYQYQLPPYTSGTWTDIPNAVFLLEKEVYEKSPGKWILKFTKKNKQDENPNAFLFEAEYYVGPIPDTVPILINNPHAKFLEGKTFGVNAKGNAAIFHAGAKSAWYKSSGTANVVTQDYLIEKGYMVDDSGA